MGTDLLPFSEVTSFVAAVSVIGIVLLLPLFISQRRDVRRLRSWMFEEPGFPERDHALSEERLDRAELQLEQIYEDQGDPVAGTAEFQAVYAANHPEGSESTEWRTGATRVTMDRPALAQKTMEISALEPHPRLKSFRQRAAQPRWLVALAVVAVVGAVVAIVGVDEILRSEEGSAPATSNASGIVVAVLNTTSADGIAGRVATQVEDSGYIRGELGTLERPTDQTFVMYQPDARRAAVRIADELGGIATQEIDQEVEAAAGDADVVVVLGEDRAS